MNRYPAPLPPQKIREEMIYHYLATILRGAILGMAMGWLSTQIAGY